MRGQRSPKPTFHQRTVLVRASADDAGFSGHASDFWSVDSYGTAIAPGAFKKTISERGDKIPVLWQHNPDWPIGKPTTLKEDDQGLAFDAAVVEESQYGKEAMLLLRGGVPLGMSFGFETIKSRRYEEADEDHLDWSNAPAWLRDPAEREYLRIIEEVRLWEISLVTFPANENATVDDVRAAQLDLLTSLSEDLRHDRIPTGDARLSRLQDLVAAYREHEPKPEPAAATTSLDLAAARRKRERDAQVAMAMLATQGVIS